MGRMQNETNDVTTTTPEATKAAFDRVMSQTYRFARRDAACRYAGHAVMTLWVMLGDDGRYWVTTPANCARLERWGYEWAA